MRAHLGDVPGEPRIAKPLPANSTWIDDVKIVAGPLACVTFAVTVALFAIVLALK